MSHYKDLKLRMDNPEILDEVMRGLNIKYNENSIAHGYGSQVINNCRYVIPSMGGYGDIGITLKDGAYTIIADDLDMDRVRYRRVVNQIRQGYSVANAKAIAESKGMTLVEERQQDGSIVLRFARPSRNRSRARTRRQYAGR